MFIIGLTGSIGMGKTTTARLFAEEGVPVHDADAAVHQLYQGEAASAIEAAFPGTTREGKVDRTVLGKRVVGDAPAMRLLEAIVHPMVRDAEKQFLAAAAASGARVAVLDIPLLFETGGENRVDAVVVVSAPGKVQRARVLERGMSQAQFEALLARQMPDAEKRRRADFVVDSSKGIEPARAQVRAILTAVAKMPARRRS
jgi:dephospho-CoA kinase